MEILNPATNVDRLAAGLFYCREKLTLAEAFCNAPLLSGAALHNIKMEFLASGISEM